MEAKKKANNALIDLNTTGEIYGTLICVFNPEGFHFIEGRAYTISGQGGAFFDKEDNKYRESFGFFPDGEEEVYAYRLVDEMSNNGTVGTILPEDIIITHFAYLSEYKDIIPKIQSLKREKEIDKLL